MAQQIKILNVNMSLDPVAGGGTAERTLQMSKFLAKAGINCTILTTNSGLREQHFGKLKNLNIVLLPTLVDRFFIPNSGLLKIKRIIKDVDIVHLMNHWTLINALVYFIARSLRKPYVVCPAGALTIRGRSEIMKKLYNFIVGRNIIRSANRCIAISPNEEEQFHAYGVSKEKITHIPNCINPDDFQENDNVGFRRKFGLGEAPFILFMGRLNAIKGPDLLLHAFCHAKEKLKNFHLVFAGPDEGMLTELKRIAADHGAGNRVHFIGYIEGNDKSHAYHAADLFVIPSRKEAMSIVALEAGVTGTPVLLTDQCGFDDVARVHGGLMVSATVDGLQHGLVEMLQDKDSLAAMGMKLKEHVISNFTWDIIVERYRTLYNGILF
jgi:glycosyltransferase involved in cell wall biosynthesis